MRKRNTVTTETKNADCGHMDCFAHGGVICKALKEWNGPRCSFYKTKDQFFEENEYLKEDEFILIFGRELLPDRRKYQIDKGEDLNRHECELQQDHD